MNSVNKVILVGNVGKDPEVRYLEGNVAVCRFSLATSDSYKNRNGELVTQTEWHNIVLWRGLADVAQKFVKKGSQLYIEGKISNRSYDDKDGNKRFITEIVAQNMVLLGRRQEGGSAEPEMRGSSAPSSEPTDPGIMQEQGDDLPF